MSDKNASLTTWALIGGAAISAVGWISTTFKDNSNAGSTLVNAATELVDRLTGEINRQRVEASEMRRAADDCEQKYERLLVRMRRLEAPLEQTQHWDEDTGTEAAS